jgi:hypothetical protein
MMGRKVYFDQTWFSALVNRAKRIVSLDLGVGQSKVDNLQFA